MSDVKQCFACNTENDLAQKYCTQCGGANFQRQVVGEQFNLSDFIKCLRCGKEWNARLLESCPGCSNGPSRPVSSQSTSTVATGRSGTGMKISAKNIILTTAQTVPSREIASVIGLVFAAGNAAWTLEGTSKKSNTAMGKASNNLGTQALQLGADAVIAIQMSIDGSGTAVNRSQTVTLIGTAVKLKPISGNG